MLLVFLFLRLIHLHLQPLLAADEDSAGFGTLIGADDALLLHLIHDAGGAGITQLTAALQQAGGCLPGIDDHLNGLLEHRVAAGLLIRICRGCALLAILNGVRIQGTFVRDEEISRVLDFIKQSATVQYDEAMIEAMEKHAIQDGKKGGGGADAEEDAGSDPMFKQAVDVVIDAGQASTSLLQRRCKLGYARAARIMDEMEQKSIIGPYEGAKPRAVLISRQQWLEMQMNQPEE